MGKRFWAQNPQVSFRDDEEYTTTTCTFTSRESDQDVVSPVQPALESTPLPSGNEKELEAPSEELRTTKPEYKQIEFEDKIKVIK